MGSLMKKETFINKQESIRTFSQGIEIQHRKLIKPELRHNARIVIATYLIIWCVVAFTLHNAINRYDAESYIYWNIREASYDVQSLVSETNKYLAFPPEVRQTPDLKACGQDHFDGCDRKPPIIGIPLVTVMITDYIKLNSVISQMDREIEYSTAYISQRAADAQFQHTRDNINRQYKNNNLSDSSVGK